MKLSIWACHWFARAPVSDRGWIATTCSVLLFVGSSEIHLKISLCLPRARTVAKVGRNSPTFAVDFCDRLSLCLSQMPVLSRNSGVLQQSLSSQHIGQAMAASKGQLALVLHPLQSASRGSVPGGGSGG